jgi:chromosome segregation ATPase
VSEHDEVYERAEREADDLERKKDKLDEDIERTRKDWESKQSDESVPGARPDEDDEEDGPPPEADVVTPGD